MTLFATSAPGDFSTAAISEFQNKTNATECETEQWVLTVVPVYILCIAVLGIVCNVFVLMVFCLHKKPCTVPEIYLSNLAAADLVLVSCLPFWAVNVYKNFNWPFGLALCKLVNMGISMNFYCSIYFLVMVSKDRYVALVHTMSCGKMRQPKYAKLCCLLVWCFGLLLSVPMVVYRNLYLGKNTTRCYVHYPNEIAHWLLEGMLTLFSLFIPIPIISYCTFKIIKALNSRLMNGSNSHNTEHKATILVLAVLLAFLICSVPFHVLRTVELFMRLHPSPPCNTILDTCLQIFTYLAFFNSVLNPILYVIVGKNFRRKVKEVFKQRRSQGTFTMTTSTRTQSNLSRSVKCASR